MSAYSIVSQHNNSHEAQLSQGIAGCYYCVSCFPVSLIQNWVSDPNGRTAICPFCHIDAVLPECALIQLGELLFQDPSLGLEVTHNILTECQQVFF